MTRPAREIAADVLAAPGMVHAMTMMLMQQLWHRPLDYAETRDALRDALQAYIPEPEPEEAA